MEVVLAKGLITKTRKEIQSGVALRLASALQSGVRFNEGAEREDEEDDKEEERNPKRCETCCCITRSIQGIREDESAGLPFITMSP